MRQSEVAMKELVGSELYQNFIKDLRTEDVKQGHLHLVRTPEVQEETKAFVREGNQRVLQAIHGSRPHGFVRVWRAMIDWLNDESPEAPQGYHL